MWMININCKCKNAHITNNVKPKKTLGKLGEQRWPLYGLYTAIIRPTWADQQRTRLLTFLLPRGPKINEKGRIETRF